LFDLGEAASAPVLILHPAPSIDTPLPSVSSWASVAAVAVAAVIVAAVIVAAVIVTTLIFAIGARRSGGW
jgi:hypothetical protein